MLIESKEVKLATISCNVLLYLALQNLQSFIFSFKVTLCYIKLTAQHIYHLPTKKQHLLVSRLQSSSQH